MDSNNKHPDKHPLDPYLKIFSCRCFLITSFIVATMLGVFLSIYKNDWNWINRFGAVVAVVGLLFTMSPIFANGIYKSQSQAGRMASVTPERSIVVTTEEERKIGENVALGIIVSILGALANAFGDLIASAL